VGKSTTLSILWIKEETVRFIAVKHDLAKVELVTSLVRGYADFLTHHKYLLQGIKSAIE